MNYYWTCQDSEWAMDLVFRDPQQLQRLYPQLVHLGMTSFSSPDGLRLMGKRVTRQGAAFGAHEAPVSSDLKVGPNGVRIKRRLGANSQWRAMRRGWLISTAAPRFPRRLWTAQELTAQLECRVRWHGRPVRALHPFQPEDHALLRAVNRGEFAIHGLRNRDLQQLLL